MITYQCPHCGKVLEIAGQYALQVGKCKGCGRSLSRPAVAESASAPESRHSYAENVHIDVQKKLPPHPEVEPDDDQSSSDPGRSTSWASACAYLLAGILVVALALPLAARLLNPASEAPTADQVPHTQIASSNGKSAGLDEPQVYIQADDRYYHLEGCPGLNAGNTAYPKGVVIAQGYQPCPRCGGIGPPKPEGPDREPETAAVAQPLQAQATDGTEGNEGLEPDLSFSEAVDEAIETGALYWKPIENYGEVGPSMKNGTQGWETVFVNWRVPCKAGVRPPEVAKAKGATWQARQEWYRPREQGPGPPTMVCVNTSIWTFGERPKDPTFGRRGVKRLHFGDAVYCFNEGALIELASDLSYGDQVLPRGALLVYQGGEWFVAG